MDDSHRNNPLSPSSNPSSSSQSSSNYYSRNHHEQYVQPPQPPSQPRFLLRSEFLQPPKRRRLTTPSFSSPWQNQLLPPPECLPPPQRRRLTTPSFSSPWQNQLPPPSEFLPPLERRQMITPPGPWQNQLPQFSQFLIPHHQPLSNSSFLVPLQNQPSPLPQFQPQHQPFRGSSFLVPSQPLQHHRFRSSLPLQNQDSPATEFFQPPEQQPFRSSPFLGHSQNQRSLVGEPLRPPQQQRLMIRPPQIVVPNQPISQIYSKPGTVETLEYLKKKGFHKIDNEVVCEKCWNISNYAFDLEEKFIEVAQVVRNYKEHKGAKVPMEWLETKTNWFICEKCNQRSSKPQIPLSNQNIKWLFLFLGQMLGLCSRHQLEYFCLQNGIDFNRKDPKKRLLYWTYLRICKQLDPKGPYDD